MKKLSDMVREIARVGIVNWKADRPQLLRAAKELDERERRIRKLEMRCEDLEERVAIMAADLKRQEEGNLGGDTLRPVGWMWDDKKIGED